MFSDEALLTEHSDLTPTWLAFSLYNAETVCEADYNVVS